MDCISIIKLKNKFYNDFRLKRNKKVTLKINFRLLFESQNSFACTE